MTATIVVNFGTAHLISKYFNDHRDVYIVDNFKSEDETQRIGRVAERLGAELIKLPRNIGFGAAVNRGIAKARDAGHEHFAVVNPDLKVDPEVLLELARRVGASPQTMFSPRICDIEGRVWFEGSTILKWRGMARHAPASRGDVAPWLSGACLIFSINQWERLGGFDEDYFLYWEDVDFTFRWAKQFGTLRIAQDLVAFHDVGGSQQGAGKSILYTSMISRNRLLFARRNLGLLDQLRWIVCTPAFVLSVVKNARHASMSLALRHLWAAARNAFIVLPIDMVVDRGR